MNVITICMISLVGVILYLILKGYKQEYSMLIIVVLSLLFGVWMLEILKKMEEFFYEISSFLEENKTFYKILFKIIGITYICEFTSGICKDAGASSVGNQIEIVGKMLVLVSGIPILISVIEAIKEYNI
ncbi:MAG: stage III sporulation protein AD [Lachnospiraceae bacterium]|nr:stage III sporulation protein AD [Lachnospiraceae bacterium]